MRNLLTALVLFASAAAAHAQFMCAPKTESSPNEAGTIQVSEATPLGRWVYFWCPEPNTTNMWRWQSFAVLKKYQNTISDPLAVMAGVLSAPDKLLALNSVVTSATITPAAGSQDEYDWKSLIYAACLSAGNPPSNMVPHVVKPAARCEVYKPTPITPPAGTWVTPTAGTIFTYAGGKLTGVTGRKAVKGAICDCASAKAVVGTTTYCAIAGAVKTEVTACVKQ
jgi:hypothetical protein